MAATRKDRGNSWASRAPLNDDRAAPIDRGMCIRCSGIHYPLIVSKLVATSKQLFQAEPAAGGQVVVLSFADWWTHSIRRQTAART